MSDQLQNPSPELSGEVRMWAMFCHFSAFLGLVFPLGSLLGPLIVWQIRRELDPFIDDQGKEALNFQITVTIAMLICIVLMVVLIGFPLMAVVCIGALVLTIIGGIKANDGHAYRYPFTWRLIK